MQIVVVLLFLGSSTRNAQRKPKFSGIEISGDPRCAETFGVDSCGISLYRGLVTEVIDGHTISVTLRPFIDSALDSIKNGSDLRVETRLSLASISVPEIDAPLGEMARDRVAKLLPRKEVAVQFFCVAKTATVIYAEFDEGLEQIKAGLARFDSSQSDAQENTRCNYRFAEAKAKSEHLGIWKS